MTELEEKASKVKEPQIPLYLVVPSDPDLVVLSRPLAIRVLRSLSDAHFNDKITYLEMDQRRRAFQNPSLTRLDLSGLGTKAKKIAMSRERWDLNHPALAGYFENGESETETSK